MTAFIWSKSNSAPAAAEICECFFEATDHRRHRLARMELEPEQPRIADHHEERVAFAPGKSELGEVDLGLMRWRRFEPDDRLRLGARSHVRHKRPELRESTGIAGVATLREEPHRRELRVRLESRADDRLIARKLRRRCRARPTWRWLGEIAIELAGVDQVIDPNG